MHISAISGMPLQLVVIIAMIYLFSSAIIACIAVIVYSLVLIAIAVALILYWL